LQNPAVTAWRSLRGLPAEVWVLFAANLVNRIGTMALPFLVLYLTRSLGFPPGRAGAYVALYGICGLVVSPLGGRLSDRLGPLRVMQASLAASGVALLMYPLARGPASVALMTALWAAAGEVFRPASLAAVTDIVTPEQRRTAFSLNRLAINLGMSIGPALGGFLAAKSFGLLFLADGATSLAAAAVLLFAPWRVRHRAARSAEAAAPRTGWAKDRRLVYFLLAMLPVTIVFFQHEAAMPLFLVQGLALSERVYGLLFTLNTLLIVTLEVPLNAWMADWPHRYSLAIGAVLFGIGFGLLAVAKGVATVAMTVVVWTFGEMTLLPAMAAYVAEIAPEDRRGEYMGLYTMAFGLAFTIGPWLGTEVLSRHGAVAVWGGTFVFGVASALLFLRIREPERAGH
jgi:predicted MFS family arabinose efflux permease